MRPDPPATPPRPAVHGALVRALLVLVMVATPLRAQAPPQLLPVDQAAIRPEFFSFRAQLQRALAERDSAAVLAIVDPNIKNSFGDDDGIASFRKMWTPERPDSE